MGSACDFNSLGYKMFEYFGVVYFYEDMMRFAVGMHAFHFQRPFR